MSTTQAANVPGALHATIGLRKAADGISAYIKIPGAVVAATAHSVKDALKMLAEALDEKEEPFWL